MARQQLLGLLAVALLAAALLPAACYDYDYDGYDYDSSYYSQEEYEELDEYGYYSDELQDYYDEYSYYSQDGGDYDDGYYTYDDDLDYAEVFEDCHFSGDGKVVLGNDTAKCDLKIEGGDKQADKLTGGLDGVYKLTSCHGGKPLYKRDKSPAGEDRVLWYSSSFGDWDVSKGANPNDAEILMYGGEMDHASVPLHVTSWHVGADLASNSKLGDDDYVPIKLKISCADGKVYKASAKDIAAQQKKRTDGPVLTDDEMESKYRYIYEKYGARAEPSPTVNFTFVVLLVMTGLTIVLAIPYFLLGKGRRGGKPQPIAASFHQMIKETKKKASGHDK